MKRFKKISSFGYIPDYKENKFIDMSLRIIGLPILFRRIEARYIMRMMEGSGQHVLDIGAGDGIFELELAKRGYNVYGLDINRKQLLLAKKRSEMMELGDRINLLLADAEHLPFKENVFDTCMSNCTLEHIKDDEKVIKQVYETLKKDGIFILSVPHYYDRVIIPLVSFWLKLPKSARKIMAPEFLWSVENQTYKDVIWSLKRDRFKEHRNYYTKNLFRMAENIGFITCEWDYAWKFFGAILADLIHGIRFIHYNKGMVILFPLMYPIAILDEFLPKNFTGREIIVKFKK